MHEDIQKKRRQSEIRTVFFSDFGCCFRNRVLQWDERRNEAGSMYPGETADQ